MPLPPPTRTPDVPAPVFWLPCLVSMGFPCRVRLCHPHAFGVKRNVEVPIILPLVGTRHPPLPTLAHTSSRARLLKLIKWATVMQHMLKIVASCLVALYNIAFLLLLFCYVFRLVACPQNLRALWRPDGRPLCVSVDLGALRAACTCVCSCACVRAAIRFTRHPLLD